MKKRMMLTMIAFLIFPLSAAAQGFYQQPAQQYGAGYWQGASPYAAYQQYNPYQQYGYGMMPQQQQAQPITTYHYQPQGAYQETEVWVPVVRYEKRKAYQPVGVVMPGQMPVIQQYNAFPTGTPQPAPGQQFHMPQ
ncbi:hypothetical protein Selin_1279 [Desulfurispirillum indicum S5]|uniref:Uncharacterized protein n=1 Tax=Desulfurispirillum indicum (strain ATCC BAA-1389 / DSM 22839 / S5) TaxID=653733 RepID=E6W538_DESIS|nr:hypothetical protein [Desulfurispirillum indicum]ADU66014.1 hypothetical protein Selin_1279 [Desulfurispirillum indicum S5]